MSTYSNFSTVEEWKNLKQSLDAGKVNRCGTDSIEECSGVLSKLSDLHPNFYARDLQKRLGELENQIIETNLEYDSFISSVDNAIISVQKMEEGGEVLPEDQRQEIRGN